MTSVPVCDVFVDEGSFAFGTPLLSVLDSSLNGEDVHAVDLETGNVLTALVVVGKGGSAVSGSTHSILVV